MLATTQWLHHRLQSEAVFCCPETPRESAQVRTKSRAHGKESNVANAARGTSAPGPLSSHMTQVRTCGTPAFGPAFASLADEELTIDIRLFDDADNLLGDGPDPFPGPEASAADTGAADAGTPATETPAPEAKATEPAIPDNDEPADPPADAKAETETPAEPEEPVKYLGRYNTPEEADRAHKSLQTQYQSTKALVDQVGGEEALRRMLEQQQAQTAATQQAATPAQPAEPEVPEGYIDTPWGVITNDEADAKSWELGQARFADAMADHKIKRAEETRRAEQERTQKAQTEREARQKENSASALRQMGQMHKDFQTFLPAIQELGMRPGISERIVEAAAEGPEALVREIDDLYFMAKGRAAEEAVAEAGKAARADASVRQEQQRAASVGTSTSRQPVQSEPDDHPFDELMEPIVNA